MASPTDTKGIEAVLANPPADMPSDLTLAFLQESRDRGAIIAILVITSFVMIVVACALTPATFLFVALVWTTGSLC